MLIYDKRPKPITGYPISTVASGDTVLYNSELCIVCRESTVHGYKQIVSLRDGKVINLPVECRVEVVKSEVYMVQGDTP